MTDQKQIIFCVGASHKSADVPTREKLHIPEGLLPHLLQKIQQDFALTEVAALSTCNRFELFGVCRADTSEDSLYELMHHLQTLAKGHPIFRPEELSKVAYVHRERAAVQHLFAVASSIDSLVVGETQITGQFKRALQIAGEAKTSGSLLSRLGQEALNTAKKVRTQTEIGRHTVSISHAAIELAAKVFGDISAHRVLIIGAGEMARVAAQHVLRYKPKELSIANRTWENAQKLVNEIGQGQPFPLEDLPVLLCEADIVLCSTASQHLVITQPLVKQSLGSRRGRPQILIDIAIPRNIDPQCSSLDDVYLFDIDDLQQVVSSHADERQHAARQAIGFISANVEQWQKWWDSLALKPVLANFRLYLDRLMEQEFQRTHAKEFMRTLSEEQRGACRQMLESIAGKISGDVGRTLRHPPEGLHPLQIVESLEAILRRPDGDTETLTQQKEKSL